MRERRTLDNSGPLNARVTLALADRLRRHLISKPAHGGALSDFVSDAIEEKLAREGAGVDQRSDP